MSKLVIVESPSKAKTIQKYLGKEITMYVNVGDKVMCPRYGGAEIKLDGVEYTVVRQSDIMAVVE